MNPEILKEFKELYNSKEKIEFIQTIENDDVKMIYFYIFLKSMSSEQLYNKDLYNVSLDQLALVMRNINHSTINNAINSKSRIISHITCAIQNGRRTNNTNPLVGTDGEWEKQFIDKSIKRFYSDLEIYELVESLLNAQDQALIQCIFEGIMGKTYSELINLRASDIDWDNNLVTVREDEDNVRTVKVSDRCLRYLKNAYEQEYYFPENGGVEKKLIKNQDYIFKNTLWKSTVYSTVSAQTLNKRLLAIRKAHDLDTLRAKDIKDSGMIHMAYVLGKDKKAVEKDEFTKIGDKYNYNKITSNGYSYYNVTYMKQFINSKNIKELYGVDYDV